LLRRVAFFARYEASTLGAWQIEWPHIAEGNQCVPHMLQILQGARKFDIRVFYAMHRRYRQGDYETWKYIAPIEKAPWSRKSLEYGTWGGETRTGFEPRAGDMVAAEHWCSRFRQHGSGFAGKKAWHP